MSAGLNNRRRMIRQAFTVARRDFTATVFTPLFLLFLLSPLIMISLAVGGALGGSTLARGGIPGRDRLVAIVSPADSKAMAAADMQLRIVFRPGDAPPPLTTITAGAKPEAQAREAFAARDVTTAAVLYGPLDRPEILIGPKGARTADYLARLAEQVLRDRAAGVAHPLSTAEKRPFHAAARGVRGGNEAALFGVTGIFFLTLFLAGQSVGTMAEERSNKVIEILAAAVPLEAVFLGKLLGMFGVAVLFVGFWGTLVSQVGALLPGGPAALASVAPAIGFPAFVLLFFAYFMMAYMLLGAVFLGVGAQASTMREIQMLSLPITIVQMAMFGLASAAASQPGTNLATFAELFPLSSPFAMAAHAANRSELWPHLAALAWQAMWVSIVIWIGASAFRRGVLKSGGGPPRLWSFARRG